MTLIGDQTPIDVSGSSFPKFVDSSGKTTERFWYIRDEFVRNSQDLLKKGRIYSCISARLENERWVCDGAAVASADVASFLSMMRLFYMKSEAMSIYSLCTYMEKHIENASVRLFFKHMRESWEEYLDRTAILFSGYVGPIKKNKDLIDVVLYSGIFHSQEKYKIRYKDLLMHMDESLIIMTAYNALHSGYQMNQISRALGELSEDNFVVLLPNHLRHIWDENSQST